MKKYQLVKVTSPSIEFECMGEVIPSAVIDDTKKTPNFAEPVLERRILVSLMRQLLLMVVENYSYFCCCCLCVCSVCRPDLVSLSVCLSVCLLVCLSVCLSVCLFVSVCVFLRLSNPPSYSLANDFTDREHVSMKYLTIPISTVAILLMEFLKSACGNGCQYKLS